MIDGLMDAANSEWARISCGAAIMLIGDSVTYRGRRHVVVGFTPASVAPFEVQLEDPESKRRFWTAWPAEPPQRAALRLAGDDANPRREDTTASEDE